MSIRKNPRDEPKSKGDSERGPAPGEGIVPLTEIVHPLLRRQSESPVRRKLVTVWRIRGWSPGLKR